MNETINLSPRQGAIINLLALNAGLSREDIALNLPSMFSISRATLARDLMALIKAGLVLSVGMGRSTMYKASRTHPLLTYIDLKQYFSLEPDSRKDAKRNLDPRVFDKLSGIINKSEHHELQTIFRPFSVTTRTLDHTIVERELERYLIEL